MDQPIVSVVIPACNAAATLRDTLGSVLRQTYPRLEVVIVDDGSVDGTADIAAAAARRDPRVRLVRQANAGVAAARNRGVAETGGPFVAFLDADDLWAPDKIARQVAALQAADDETALCYTWFVNIDAAGAILRPGLCPSDRGAVLTALCQYNFVGNGSSMLVRRTALARIGGFDESLRDGCEDYDLLLRLAEAYEFALVADHLVGYRTGADTMSGRRPRMVRAWCRVSGQAARRRPDLEPLLARGRITFAVFLMTEALLRGRVIEAVTLPGAFGLPLRRVASPLARAVMIRVRQAAGQALRRLRGAPRRFFVTQPVHRPSPWGVQPAAPPGGRSRRRAHPRSRRHPRTRPGWPRDG